MAQIGSSENVVGTTGTAWPQQDYCSSRLPCGVCIILGKVCPKEGYMVTPTWEVTCKSEK